MAEIIDFPKTTEAKIRELERILTEGMHHPNMEILKIWQEMAKDSLRKHPGSPHPTNSKLSLTFPASVTQEEADAIGSAVKEFIESYKKDVEKEMMEMLTEIIILQKTVAEHQVGET